MPRRSGNRVTAEKTAAVSEAMPHKAPKNIRKEYPDVPEKGRVTTFRTTEPKLARHKRVAQPVITVLSSIISLPQS